MFLKLIKQARLSNNVHKIKQAISVIIINKNNVIVITRSIDGRRETLNITMH